MAPHLSFLVSLPVELLISIIAFVRFPELDPTDDWPFNGYSSVSSLSMVNWQLRQICLPFLFETISINSRSRIEKFEANLALSSKLTKTLIIEECYDTTLSETPIRYLQDLKQLLYVELEGCSPAPAVLLRAILAHPTVRTVRVRALPDFESMQTDDLSKIILYYPSPDLAFSPGFDKFLNRGMKLTHLSLDVDGTPREYQLISKLLPGIQSITVFLYDDPMIILPLQLFNTLSSTQSTLTELQLDFDCGLGGSLAPDLTYHIMPFISSCIKESHWQDLLQLVTIDRVLLVRRKGQSSHEWYVEGLNAQTTISLIEALTLVASSCPELKVLNFSLKVWNFSLNPDVDFRATDHIDDVVTVLKQFPSLKELCLCNVLERLDFGPTTYLPPLRDVDRTDALDILLAHAETAILQYASQVARAVRTLVTLTVWEFGYEGPWLENWNRWNLKGSLHVANSNRDISGKLFRSTSPSRDLGHHKIEEMFTSNCHSVIRLQYRYICYKAVEALQYIVVEY
ncbi:hypothetical protein FB446DRAFT_737242, partial [Lentinula raphanica]